MSRLTEIMKQIPLDELMGDADITETEKNKEQNKETTGGIVMNNEEMRSEIKHTGAYAKRTGALVSAAAIALVAIGGAFAYLKLSKTSPEASDINTSTPSSQLPETSSVPDSQSAVKPSTPETFAANQATLRTYLDSKAELKETGYTLSEKFVDADADHLIAVYRVGGKSVLCRVSGSTVTEYEQIEAFDMRGLKYDLPYDIYDSRVFELNGTRFAAMLVETASNGGVAPAIMIVSLDTDEPMCSEFGYYYLNMKRYCADAKVEYHSENSLYDIYSLGGQSPEEVLSIKDVMEFSENSINIEGIKYSFTDGKLSPIFQEMLNEYINQKTDVKDPEISRAYTYANNYIYAYGAYFDPSANGGSVICKASSQAVIEYSDKFFTGDSNMGIAGRIYAMESWIVVNSDGGTKELLAILADKVTNGGIAPMIVLLDISSESPVAIMSEPIMIDMTHYDKDAQMIKDGDTIIYSLDRFDDTVWTYVQTTDKGLRIDGKLYIIKDGKLVEDHIPE